MQTSWFDPKRLNWSQEAQFPWLWHQPIHFLIAFWLSLHLEVIASHTTLVFWMNRHCTLKDRDRRSLHSLAINGFFFFLNPLAIYSLPRDVADTWAAYKRWVNWCCATLLWDDWGLKVFAKQCLGWLKHFCPGSYACNWRCRLSFNVMVATRICKPPSSSSTYIWVPAIDPDISLWNMFSHRTVEN